LGVPTIEADDGNSKTTRLGRTRVYALSSFQQVIDTAGSSPAGVDRRGSALRLSLASCAAQIRDILVAKKLKRWLLVARYPFVDRTCPPSKARRNYWRLFAKHSELATRLGLSITSVYTR
jgi:hypothetical protein